MTFFQLLFLVGKVYRLLIPKFYLAVFNFLTLLIKLKEGINANTNNFILYLYKLPNCFYEHWLANYVFEKSCRTT